MLRSSADLVRTLNGQFTTSDLYDLGEQHGLRDLPGARKRIHGGPEQFHRRVRSALQWGKSTGLAENTGPARWLIGGSRDEPRWAVLVWLTGEPSQLELALGEAADILRQCPEPADLVLADPPWGLGRNTDDRLKNGYGRTYERNHDLVMPGYVDVDPREYEAFTEEWVTAAADAIRPGGYLAIVTGPQQSAWVQVAAERAGLTYVNSISSRVRGLHTRRRFAHTHNRTTVMTRGPLKSALRVFTPPPEMPRGEAGEVYAEDIWTDVPFYSRAGLLRYDNALSPVQVARIVGAHTHAGHLVADPFLGSGTTAEVCLLNGRRFYGGDLNPNSLRFAAGRIAAETLPAMARGIQANLHGGLVTL